jgi:hypothetical protein
MAKGMRKSCQVRIREASANKLPSMHRNCFRRHQNRGYRSAPGRAWRKPTYWPCGVRCRGGATLIWAPVWNLGTCSAMLREKAQVADPRGRKYRCAKSGADCLVVARKRGNARGAKGAGHSRRDHSRPTATRDEPCGRAGRRQPSGVARAGYAERLTSGSVRVAP